MQELSWDVDRHCLRLDVSSLSLGIKYIEISDWQQGLAWRTETLEGVINEEEGLEAPGLAFLLDSEHACAIKWRATIPAPLLEQVNKWPFMRFSLLRAFALSESAIQMFEQHSLLLMLWVDHCVRHEYSTANFRGGMGRTNKHLMFMMGLSSGKTALRVVKALEGRIDKRHRFSELSEVLRNTTLLENLKHEPVLSFELIRFLLVFPTVGNSALTKTYTVLSRQERTAMDMTLLDIERIAAQLRESVNWRAIRQCSSRKALEGIHDKLTDRFNARAEPLSFDADFPPPPLAGNEHIVAITDGQALKAEGRKMRHCAGSYQHEVLEGGYYVYRILWPERATLGVWIERRGSKLNLKIDQLKGEMNKEISMQTKQYVLAWLKKARE